jgi:hypothetical protein
MTPEEAGVFSGPSGSGTHPYIWRIYPGTGDDENLFRTQPMPARAPLPLSPSASDERLDTSAVIRISIPPLVDIDGDGFLDIVDTGDTFLTECDNELLGNCDWTVYLGDGSGRFAETLDAFVWDVPTFGIGLGRALTLNSTTAGWTMSASTRSMPTCAISAATVCLTCCYRIQIRLWSPM